MQNRPSIKKTIVAALEGALSTDECKDNRLILVVPTGVITGKPVYEDPSNRDINDVIISVLSEKIESTYREMYSIDSDSGFPGSDGYLPLRDVELSLNNGRTYSFKEFVVFFDQIVAASIGNID